MMRLNDLQVAYGPITVIKGVTMRIERGSITCLIGANGAGKTTILNTISGLVAPLAGEIRFEETLIGGMPPEAIVRLGVVQVPEGRKVFRNLTVYECLLMGGLSRKDKTGVAEDIEEIYRRFPRLAERAKQLAGTLSGGEQQMLAFGRALVARPKLLLLVEQNAEMALRLADQAYVLETGRISLSGPARDLIANDDVRKAFLGV